MAFDNMGGKAATAASSLRQGTTDCTTEIRTVHFKYFTCMVASTAEDCFRKQVYSLVLATLIKLGSTTINSSQQLHYMNYVRFQHNTPRK